MTTFTSFAALIEDAQQGGQLPPVPPATMTSLVYAVLHGLLDLKAGGRMREAKGITSVLNGVMLLVDLLTPPQAARGGLSRR